MGLGDQWLTEADALLERQKKDRLAAYKAIQTSVASVEKDLGTHVDAALDGILAKQRRLEDECLAMGKNQVQFHQKTIRWKAEYKRFVAELEDLQKFEQWVELTEANMHAVCGKLEYVCHELSRPGESQSQPASNTSQPPSPSKPPAPVEDYPSLF
ncbi:Aste57867_3257 [Aphanomyces stellatus]|uniref:Aste57867_3257 protein n=1 Tax=Aphanomyces stellatus TaxID=120398 RepID=A0A485KB10_9STRA|nr:hypothetical protein As57867_003247 [Aphanomyces stellatus]VFT80429.1 Aste57867_3257 [Aphanomyces stellatus]